MQDMTPWRNQPLVEMTPRETETVYIPESEESHLRDYLKILRKRRWVVIVALLAVVGYGAYTTLRATPMYTAKVTLKIESPNTSVTGMGEVMASQVSEGGTYDYYQTQFALLQSRPLAARVIVAQQLESNPIFTGATPRTPGPLDRAHAWLLARVAALFRFVSDLFRADPTQTAVPAATQQVAASDGHLLGVRPGLIGRYMSFLQVQPVRNTRLVQIAFITPDPTLSMELANAHATAFIRRNLETRFELTKEAREFLEKKLAEIKAKVEGSENGLNRFHQKHGVVSLERGENIVVERVIDLNKRLTEATARRLDVESLYRVVKNKNLQALSRLIDNSAIQQLKAHMSTLGVEEARLATVYKPNHPRLHEVVQQMSEVQRRLNQEITTIVRGIETEYTAARDKEQTLQAEARRQQQLALNLKEVGVEYVVLQGQVEASRSVYQSVLKRLNETNVSQDTLLGNIQITEPAERPLAPSSPQTQRDLLLATVLGLFLGVGLAFFLEYLDTTVRTAEDVWRAVALPTLGVIPHLSSLRNRIYGYGRLPKRASVRGLVHPAVAQGQVFSQTLMVSHHPLSLICESYRSVRTALLLAQAEKPPQVVLLTSAHAGEGKTSTTLNLAISLAQNGRSVVVVDADLRKGNCHTLLHLRRHPGLTYVLTGAVPVEEVVQQSAVAGLALLARGGVPPNPPDLLGSHKMQQVLQCLRKRYEFVLIDSPPAMVLSDAAVLATQSDGVLLVVRGEKTGREVLGRLVQRLELVHGKLLGVVLNGIDIRNPDYADYRYYYSSSYAAAREERER
jgi:capsular exopolysaccharide synthesis family protein